MKIFLFTYILFFGFSGSILIAQDYSRQDDDLSAFLYDTLYMHKLYEVAWENYPQNKTFYSNIEIAELQKSSEKWSWLNAVSFNYIYYPDFLNPAEDPTQTQANFRSFGIGLSLNLGTILSVPNRVAVANQNIKIAEYNLQTQMVTIRAEVNRRYFSYVQQLRLMQARMRSLEDDRSNLVLAKYRYDNGEINLQDYNQSLTTYNATQERVFETESNLASAKSNLEEILGVRIETIRRD